MPAQDNQMHKTLAWIAFSPRAHKSIGMYKCEVFYFFLVFVRCLLFDFQKNTDLVTFDYIGPDTSAFCINILQIENVHFQCTAESTTHKITIFE